MARKNPFANLMADNHPDNGMALDYTVKGASRSIISTIDELAERADKMLEGQTVVELDPAVIDGSFVRDRLEEDPQALSELVAAIRDHGQNSPILLRPHPKDSRRYMVVFGHRRLKAARALGRPVRAVVKPMADRDHVIAQGQENSARADLSFIEKAVFARQLSALNYDSDSATVMAALSIDRATLSKMLSVANMPDDVLAAIGGARSPGRDRWYALKLLLEKPANLEFLRAILTKTDLTGLTGDARFAFVVDALTRRKPVRLARAPKLLTWAPCGKEVAIKIHNDGKNYTLSLKARDAVGFGEFIAASLDELYADYRQQQNKG
ncbi:plasmid partitioning protein RepB [Agrobacterium vitis]|uniref:plasmid partitioning protein RepB n=1 Tax=Agrobacterium vitis TaxID=373 RepID=UPI001572B269|nr:plasmid partitioning protein RepB [Agrobacterium vitis]NSZ19524.1 plasmid partitioning protein RepB [Agrobacterium vitis]QZO06832.1 plasmid partitioning protein RepB [Agrobacterium vitis]UJL91493.1 plasmid partitioning protein RepB [Agrobacterium vitis]